MATHIGRDIHIEVDGRRYKLGRWTRDLDAKWIEWALKQLPDPVQQAKEQIKGFPPDLQQTIVKEALDLKRRRDAGTSDDLQDLRNTIKGAWQAMVMMLQLHQPELTEHDAGKIFDKAQETYGDERLQELFAEASGVVLKKDVPEDSQKKT